MPGAPLIGARPVARWDHAKGPDAFEPASTFRHVVGELGPAEGCDGHGDSLFLLVRLDRSLVSRNWSGRQGYTSGLLPLGTPAEKDVGFPYAASWGTASSAVTAAMATFSWQRHLADHGAYADGVDRGRLRPTHRQWSAYLREVAEKAKAEIVAGEVIGLDVGEDDGGWTAGSGPSIQVAGQPHDHPRVLDGRSYWLERRRPEEEDRPERVHDRQRRDRVDEPWGPLVAR